jgi:hypothetical protein
MFAIDSSEFFRRLTGEFGDETVEIGAADAEDALFVAREGAPGQEDCRAGSVVKRLGFE